MKNDKISAFSEDSSPLLVVGSVAFDRIVTPGKTSDRTLGGAASYASIAASYYTRVRLVGVVGHDFNDYFIRRLERRDIDLEGLQKDPSGLTFYWEGEYNDDFRKRETIETQLNVFENFRPALPSTYREIPYILLGNIGPGLQLHVLEQLNGRCFVLADTMDLWIKTRLEELLTLIKKIDCLAINESEAGLLTGEKNLVLAGRKLLAMGPRMIILKKGENGAYLFHPEGIFAVPAYPVVNLKDPTGAGDAFGGAFLGYLAAVNEINGANLKKAMLYATATASLTIEAFSCDRLESAGAPIIEERYNELVKMMTF